MQNFVATFAAIFTLIFEKKCLQNDVPSLIPEKNYSAKEIKSKVTQIVNPQFHV